MPERGTVLLECLGNLVANELFSPGGAGDATIESVLKGIMHLESQCHQLLVVSNDVFADGILYPDGTQHYISVLASLHAQLAGRFERVIEVVCGIPLQLKPETTKEVVTA